MRRELAHRRLRVYETLRSAHLERARSLAPASIAFVAENYDFDRRLTDGLDIHRVRDLRQLFVLVLRGDVQTLEINEPMLLSAAPFSLTAVAAARLGSVLRRRRMRIVTYAIDNGRPLERETVYLRRPWRRFAFRFVVKLLTRSVDRIAFGTPAAMQDYRALVPRLRAETRLVPALSTPCSCVPEGVPRPPSVLFLGAFEERKGLDKLLSAWPDVVARVPQAHLDVVGRGELQARVEVVVRRDPEIEMVIDPAREEIHRLLREAKVLVLFSQPRPGWREQVGLPIVEALAHGCLVVTSRETGLADWLESAGHVVVDTDAAPAELGAAVARALESRRSPRDVRARLPRTDGRLDADHWLFAD